MSEAITTTRTQVIDAQYKDINTLTTEINTLFRQTQETMLINAIKIGRKLTQAKELLEHGQWGTWIRENLVFSQDKANDMMKIYENYGSRQESIFGELNSETFRNLGVYQAFALLKVPEEEREEFVKETHADEMSVRELKKAIAERDAAKADKKAAEAERDEAKTERDAARAYSEKLRKENNELNQKAKENAGSADAVKKAEMERDAAEEKAKVALKNMGKLQENTQKLTEEKELLLKQNEELTAKLTENKEPSAEVVENLRKELSEAAKAEGRAEAAAEIEELKKKIKASTQENLKFTILMNEMIAKFNDAVKALDDIKRVSPETGDKAKQGILKTINILLQKANEL